MFDLLRKVQWAAVDCLTGESRMVEQLPFEIGAGEGVDLKLNSQGVAERHCAINQVKGHGLCLIKQDPNLPLFVDGQPIEFCPLAPETDYAVKIGAHFLALRGGRNLDEWIKGLDCTQWTLHDTASHQVDGPMSLVELCKFAKDQQRHPQTLVQPAGLSKGFFLQDAFEVVAALESATRTDSTGEALSDITEREPRVLTCPVCWLKFELGEIMHLATHDSLRGDPVLGEDAPQRFLATRFNDRGQALDALGLPCTEMACPYCRRALPPGFIEMPHHILSIVGDQSAGKSYYLSVLMKMLPMSLYDNFSVVFQDADPAGNALLNEMKQTLFGAQTPEGARLAKTQLEGGMYVRLPRYGRLVALPKPFVFSVASSENVTRRCALIFYDNAGEHFQPGRDSAESPGAQHVASSAGIVFLFDPFNSPDFRREISDRADPQLEKPAFDQQGVILSEMKVRIAKLLNLELMQHIDTPMAVLIGKSDAWIHLLGADHLRAPVVDGHLDLDALAANSGLVRQLMKRICPQIVANAESISRRVMFFPVSSFGHAPVKLGPGDFVPDPRQLKPFQVEVPILWLLSCIEPALVPSQ
ncbi:MAG TPA: FHA domain-containing protein [Verrucomicrobiae bacterium]|nr:FHA domain-containing protein [Verrucomicrobiae bacterium]